MAVSWVASWTSTDAAPLTVDVSQQPTLLCARYEQAVEVAAQRPGVRQQGTLEERPELAVFDLADIRWKPPEMPRR